jgi:hypothetical protein
MKTRDKNKGTNVPKKEEINPREELDYTLFVPFSGRIDSDDMLRSLTRQMARADHVMPGHGAIQVVDSYADGRTMVIKARGSQVLLGTAVSHSLKKAGLTGFLGLGHFSSVPSSYEHPEIVSRYG